MKYPLFILYGVCQFMALIFPCVLTAQKQLLEFYKEYTISETGERTLDWVYTYTYDSLGRTTSQTIYVNPSEDPRDKVELKKMCYSEYSYFASQVLTSTTLFTTEGTVFPTTYHMKTYDPASNKLMRESRTEVSTGGDTLESSVTLWDPESQRITSSFGTTGSRHVNTVKHAAPISGNTLQRITYRFNNKGFSVRKSLEKRSGQTSIQRIFEKDIGNEWVEIMRYKHINKKRHARWFFESFKTSIRNKKTFAFNRRGDETRYQFYLWNAQVRKWELKNTRITSYTYDTDGNILAQSTDYGDKRRLREYVYK